MELFPSTAVHAAERPLILSLNNHSRISTTGKNSPAATAKIRNPFIAMEQLFTKIANTVAHAAGKPATFIICCAVIALWAVSGPVFGFSDTWQLIINTGTTIVTFLMVFLIQNTQNRDGAALQAKLDELIRVGEAENRFIGIEHLTEKEVEEFRLLCERAAQAHDRKQKAPSHTIAKPSPQA